MWAGSFVSLALVSWSVPSDWSHGPARAEVSFPPLRRQRAGQSLLQPHVLSGLGAPPRPLLTEALLSSPREILASKVTKDLPVARASLETLGSQATKVTQA